MQTDQPATYSVHTQTPRAAAFCLPADLSVGSLVTMLHDAPDRSVAELVHQISRQRASALPPEQLDVIELLLHGMAMAESHLVANIAQRHATVVFAHQINPAAALAIRNQVNQYLDLIGRRPRGNYLAARYQTAATESSAADPSSSPTPTGDGSAEFIDISDVQ